MSRGALGAFNQAASQELAFEHRVELVKSQGKDWNQDLKQDQLQRVVQRELGSIDEDQYGFGQQHWDNPPIEGSGKITQLREAQAQARSQGERLLVVELRESRDAVALLPALRENLEKVGFTIDHAVKLEPTAAREIATELTLRYRLDSPQLPAISDALDALRLNHRATVIEPGWDASERRQLAAAQEQQRQAGPELVPSDSPAHDQAWQSFIEAAGQVARELRASAALLDAARLQEVSRQLLTRPALEGLNQENVEKVLAVVNKLDTLKDNPAVQQLRRAVQQLEQPAQTQTMQQKTDPAPACRLATLALVKSLVQKSRLALQLATCSNQDVGGANYALYGSETIAHKATSQKLSEPTS